MLPYWQPGSAAIRAANRRVQYEGKYCSVRVLYRHGAQGADPDRRGDNGIAVNVQVGSMEGLPCKKKTSAVWPRRGYKGQYGHGGAFPNKGLWGQATTLDGPKDHGATNP